jgi:hypothetical protein
MAEPQRPLRKGLVVRLRLAGSHDEWCAGFIELASDNGKSISVTLVGGMVRGARGMYGGIIPLSVDYEAETVEALWGDEYEMEVDEALCP